MTLFSSRPVGKGVEGLARVGSRAALSFAFAFLRRAWRSGRSTLEHIAFIFHLKPGDSLNRVCVC